MAFEVVMLASCYSCGDSGSDLRLSRAIVENTPAKAVIGFQGSADLFAAVFLISNFWWQHMAGLYYAGVYYGYGAETAYDRAIWLLDTLLADVHFTVNLIISAIVSYFSSPWVFTATGILTKILQSAFKTVITEAAFALFVANIVATMNGFTFHSNGDYIGPLVSGGGGGSDPEDTID